MCKEAGYGVSIFERLQQSVSEKQFLRTQYLMHPSISKFPNHYFYEGIVRDGHNVISAEYNEFIPITLPSYGFMDISANYLRQTRKAYVSSAAIIMLVQKLCEGIIFSSCVTVFLQSYLLSSSVYLTSNCMLLLVLMSTNALLRF
jgi:hypothetical protein